MDELSDLDRATLYQNGLVSEATGGSFDGGDPAYKALRRHFAQRADTKSKLPDFVTRCPDLAQFWQWIKREKPRYEERRQLIWDAFRPLLDYLEGLDRTPAVAPITETLEAFDPDNVHAAWQKALDRRAADPEGAITAARTLLETVCKHILDEADSTYADDADLPKLWAMVSERLNLAPSQHQEESFKALLGSCQQIVNRLGALRNKIGDAHGQGRRPVRPKARHAELAVNLAGTMAAFLVATWKERAAK
ncbi:MAG: abortive infection family protein [Acetobacteraceae bacterium]